ncbi:MAG: hypothetical protein P8Q36_04015 [Alphaproteobacteria bacterium]|nr:hypothetical protein [Rhodospirillaceae bacterium]MBT7611886.1 hypothetical protein [Rhodospirillaceae bacterium]MBT7648275.1 hypothetical protein [Rhodospirillaceae bacterium]MDG2480021.1 hypothetical protein [Alphaproteobacteria bacterium]
MESGGQRQCVDLQIGDAIHQTIGVVTQDDVVAVAGGEFVGIDVVAETAAGLVEQDNGFAVIGGDEEIG